MIRKLHFCSIFQFFLLLTDQKILLLKMLICDLKLHTVCFYLTSFFNRMSIQSGIGNFFGQRGKQFCRQIDPEPWVIQNIRGSCPFLRINSQHVLDQLHYVGRKFFGYFESTG